MATTVCPTYTLIAPGRRSYTFSPLPGGAEVVVQFSGPKHSTRTTVTAEEARALYARLRKRGYERW